MRAFLQFVDGSNLGLVGSCKEAGYVGWVVIKEVVHTIAQPVSGAVGSGVTFNPASGMPPTSGRGEHGPFTVRKDLDKISPKIAAFCSAGKKLGQIKVDVKFNPSAGTSVDYSSGTMTYTMNNCYCTRVHCQGDPLIEELHFVYDKISWTYHDDASEGAGQNIQAAWDLANNKRS